MSGLTPTGFTIPTLDEIRSALATDLRARLGPTLDTSDYSVMGQIVGILAERLHELWLGERDIYAAFVPGSATGQALANLSLITGTIKRGATFSRVTGTVNLNAGVTLPAGSQARVPGAPVAFETVDPVTNGGGAPANVAVTFQAVDSGPVRANASTLTEIVTPVAGWNSVTNATDATVGSGVETDTQLRERREIELRGGGSGAVDAIAADVLNVSAAVLDVQGTENTSDATVGGLPPHSFRIVVWDGDPPGADDDAIAQAIWDAKPAGIASIGTETGSAMDRRGNPQTVSFERADGLEIYISTDIEIDATKFPADGEDQIADALTAYAAEHWKVGQPVVQTSLYGPIFSVSGVKKVNSLTLGLAPSPVGTADVAVAADEIALADTSRIVVTT